MTQPTVATAPIGVRSRVKLLFALLPLLGYKLEPITTTTVTWRHPVSGNRFGVDSLGRKIWFNYGSTR